MIGERNIPVSAIEGVVLIRWLQEVKETREEYGRILEAQLKGSPDIPPEGDVAETALLYGSVQRELELVNRIIRRIEEICYT